MGNKLFFFFRTFIVVTVFWPLTATAQLLERLDSTRLEGAVELTIRFNANVQYQRHAPVEQGRYLRIYLRVSDPNFVELDSIESLSTQKGSIPAPIRVLYPESLTSVPKALLVTFPKSTRFVVRQGTDGRSIRILLPLPGETHLRITEQESKPLSAEPLSPTQVKTGPEVAIAVSSPDAPEKADVVALNEVQVEQRAREFMNEGREAFAAKDYQRATARLYRILSLPGNSQSQPAQGLVGKVREAAGEYAKARAEYELYLKLYPSGPDAEEIKGRLSAMPKVDQAQRSRARVRSEEPANWQFYGGVSSSFFTGKSGNDGGPMTKDQSSIVSTLNMTARLRDGATDNRFVFRDTQNRNNLSPNRSYNRVYSAYAERTDRDVGYFVRAGRQNPNGSGVMERFDGVMANYSFNEDWRVGAVKGTAVEFNAPYSKTFYGGNLEYTAQAGRPGVNAYYIEQDVDGYLSRRAVGTEVRYFDGAFNSYGVVDYDVLYKEVNMVMLQGNLMDAGGNNYYASFDRRLTPMLGLTTGMSLLGQQSVADVVNLVGMQEARRLIAKGSPTSTMFGAGMMHPIGEKWQVGVDFRSSFIGGANAVLQLSQICDLTTVNEANGMCVGPNGSTVFLSSMCSTWSLADNSCISTQQASGTTNSYTLQAIGTNLFKTNAVGVANLSLTKGPTYTGQNMSLSYIYPIGESWRLEGNLRYYTQKSDTGEKADRNSPSIKLAYQWQSQMYLEGEMGRDVGKTTSGDTTTTSRRDYVYMGVRWDFR